MKKTLCLLLALVLLSGCVPQSLVRHETSVRFYYVSENPDFFSPLGIMGAETRTLLDTQYNLADMMRLYLDGPMSLGLESRFPDGLRLIRSEEAGPEITLVFDDSLAELSDIRLQLVCACIACTVADFGGYETVHLRAEHLPLDGDREMISVRPAELVLEDHSAGQPNALVLLYFSDLNSRYLLGEQCAITAADSANLPELIVRRLIEGPQSVSLLPTVPEGTELLNISVEDRICAVDFSEAFRDNRPDTALGERMTVFSVVNSLTQLDEVDAVDILVQGEKVERYLHLDLSGDLMFDERLNGPVRAGVGESDETLYVCLEGSGQLAAFPVRVREQAETDRVGPILDALRSFTEANGYYSPATQIKQYRVQRDADQLTVHLTTEKLRESEQRLLIRCVVATLRELPEAQNLQLYINQDIIDLDADPFRRDWILP